MITSPIGWIRISRNRLCEGLCICLSYTDDNIWNISKSSPTTDEIKPAGPYQQQPLLSKSQWGDLRNTYRGRKEWEQWIRKTGSLLQEWASAAEKQMCCPKYKETRRFSTTFFSAMFMCDWLQQEQRHKHEHSPKWLEQNKHQLTFLGIQIRCLMCVNLLLSQTKAPFSIFVEHHLLKTTEVICLKTRLSRLQNHTYLFISFW